MTPRSELDDLKGTAVAYPIYSQYANLKRCGKEWAARCPLSGHDDKTASFTLTDKDGCLIYYCHGCNRGGDVITFVQEMTQCSFSDAVAKVSGSEWNKGAAKVKEVFKKMDAAPKKIVTFKLSDLAPAEASLEKSPEALAWLKSRGITLETAKKFHLGYVQSAAAASPQHELVDRGWILFPTTSGDTVTLLKYRSVVSKAIVRKTGMETGLYNLEAAQAFEDVYLVEGEPDCLVMTQAGYNCVALPNANFNVTPEMKDRLLQADRIFLSGDSDSPGQAAMTKLWTELRDRTYLLKWPEPSKDANEAYLQACHGDILEFRSYVSSLAEKALESPMPHMHDLSESLRHVTDVSPLADPARLRFPWPRIDGWAAIKPGDVVLLSATETGTGKTSWLMNVLLENAINYGKVVVNFSAEVSPADYARRAAAYLSNQPKDVLKRTDFDFAANEMREAKFYNGYQPGADWKQVVDLLKWAKRRLGADVLVVDHLHFLTRGEKDEIKAQAEAMRAFKDLAIEYGTIVIVVGQPRKPKDEHFGRELQMRGIKGSETLASDASQVFILHRKRLGDSEGDNMPVFSPETKVILDKSREGQTQSTKLLFRGEICKFVEMDRGGMEE